MLRRLIALLVFALSVLSAEDWGPAQFLVGHWTGAGSGQPGQGSGSFSFAPDLQGSILVRKSFAEYPPANGKPGFRHDDLLILYKEGGALKAIYFDSEQHVIRYSASAVENGVAFVSEGPSTAPRYRFTYTSTGKDALKLRFEIAPPGRDFATYIEGAANRDK